MADQRLPALSNKSKKTVFIKAVFLKIEDINTIQESFTGLVFLKAKWREPSLDSSTTREIGNIKWDSLWGPKLDIHNVLGDPKQQIWRDIQFGPNGEAYALEKRRIKGTFTERMELEEFPFDIQEAKGSRNTVLKVYPNQRDLSILITSDHPEDDIQLEEDEEDISNVVTSSFVDESEWHLKRFVHCEPRITVDEFVQNKYRKPGLFFRCCVIRRAGFFLWNIMCVMSIISALSFVTFAVPRNLPQNRIQLSFILLLAGVTFKFAASQAVPKISYLTHLDRYILGSMVFLFLVAVWHGIVAKIDYEDSDDMDLYAFIGFIVLYIFLHTFFIIAMIIRGHTRRKDVHDKEEEYLERYGAAHRVGNGNRATKKRVFQKRQTSRVGNMRA